MTDDRLARWLLVLTAAVAALLALAAATGEPPGARGLPHPEFATLQRGGPGAPRAAPVLALGWAFGAVQIAFFAVCFALGLRTRTGRVPLRAPIVLATLAYAGVWTLLVASYRGFARDPTAQLVFGLPAPTAIMLFALWPLPLLFVAIYLRGFDRFFVDAAALRRFRELAAARRKEREPD